MASIRWRIVSPFLGAHPKGVFQRLEARGDVAHFEASQGRSHQRDDHAGALVVPWR